MSVEADVRHKVAERNSFLTDPLHPLIDAMIAAEPDDLPELCEQTKRLRPNQQVLIVSLLAKLWLESDGEGAENYAATADPADVLALQIKEVLLAENETLVDPEAAWARLDALEVEDLRDSGGERRRILQQLAVSDPRRALELSAGIHDSSVYSALARVDPVRAAQLLDEKENPSFQEQWSVALAWAKSDKEAALDWAEGAFVDKQHWFDFLLRVDPSSPQISYGGVGTNITANFCGRFIDSPPLFPL